MLFSGKSGRVANKKLRIGGIGEISKISKIIEIIEISKISE